MNCWNDEIANRALSSFVLLGGNKMTDESEHIPNRFQAARFVFDEYRRQEQKYFEVAAAYGRWLVASMLLVHGGGMVAILSFLGSARAASIDVSALFCAVLALTLGLVLAFATGALAWLNSYYLSSHCEEFTPISMLYNKDQWVTETSYGTKIAITFYGAIFTGTMSVLMIPATVIFTMRGYSQVTDTISVLPI